MEFKAARMKWEAFNELEERIEKLTKGYLSLKEERNNLLNLLRQKEEEISSLKGELEEMRAEKEEIRNRIIGLIEKIEKAGLMAQE
ncbi:MAG: hypothetical protein DRG36_01720 [Deltaproteobacteria bacterium]|nr:MAG: hypothetical protein DRG36_01720 [Deltaproteobacteria bacterium]